MARILCTMSYLTNYGGGRFLARTLCTLCYYTHHGGIPDQIIKYHVLFNQHWIPDYLILYFVQLNTAVVVAWRTITTRTMSYITNLGRGTTDKIDAYVSLPQFMVTAATVGKHVHSVQTHGDVGTVVEKQGVHEVTGGNGESRATRERKSMFVSSLCTEEMVSVKQQRARVKQ